MGLGRELADQARHLAEREPRTSANLRRAVSTAYYAIFHMLGEAMAERFAAGEALERFRPSFQRAVDHSTAKAAAAEFVALGESQRNAKKKERNDVPEVVATMEGVTVDDDLLQVVKALVALQQARHSADYDLGSRFGMAEVMGFVFQAEGAFAAWERAKARPAADSFLATVLLWKYLRRP